LKTKETEMFKLEDAIRQWKKTLSSNSFIEDGYSAELESNLRDEIEDLIQQGVSEEDAFHKVVSEMGQPDDIGCEFYKVYTTHFSGRPPRKELRCVPSFFWNSFKTAGRLFRRTKFYSSLNIIGLAVGIACCLIIFIYVLDETSYDAYHENADRIYRIVNYGEKASEIYHKAAVSAPMAKTLVKNYPEVENAVRFRQVLGCVLSYKQRSFVENRIIFSDREILDIFTLPFAAGNPQTALIEPYTLIMSEKTASKYFGKENPIGKTILLNNKYEYQINGIFKEIPRKSHYHFDVILSMAGLAESKENTWRPHNFNTYILLKENVDPKRLESKFPELIEEHLQPEVKAFMNEEDWKKTEAMVKNGEIQIRYYLQPLRNIHLHSHLKMELERNSDIKYIHIFSLIAVFILFTASINFINLSTARSAVRAKEVILKKVLGASRRQLINQFLLESMMFCFVSLFLAYALVFLFLPYFNQISGKELSPSELINGNIFLTGLIVTLLTCLIGGIYPALFLSRFKPSSLTTEKIKNGSKIHFLRRILVIFQFSASTALIAGTLIVFSQLHFMLTDNPGFNKNQVLVLEKTHILGDQIEAFKFEVLKSPRVSHGPISGFLPVKPSGRNSIEIFPEGKKATSSSIQVQNWTVDYDYIPTLAVKMDKGRNFSRKISSDRYAAIVNQRAVEKLGWPDPLGKTIGVSTSSQDKMKMYSIIGVVEDFHFESFENLIEPLVIFLGRNNNQICFRIEAQDIQETINFIRFQWNSFAPDQPFEYAFLDERFNEMYKTERRTGKIIGLFSILAILIGGLGLFGLAGYTAEQRTKEIGIRKVMGAKTSEVVVMICRELIKPVILANLFAWPIAFYIMNQWLQRFAYRIRIRVEIFILAAGLTFIIALAIVSWQAFRTAVSSPVKSLRYE